MRIFQQITLVLATVAPLAMGACTSTSTSGTVSAVEPSAAGVTTTDAPALSGASTNSGNTMVLPPEPGYNPDNDFEAP
jgi:hypothetical protein